jgi:hypothetical protein
MSLPILYLSGPMSGMPEDNYPAFHEAARQLREAGYLVVSPAESTIPRGSPWLSFMRKDISDMVATCDAVATLPGHENSRGAKVEIALARGLGWQVNTVDEWLNLIASQSVIKMFLDSVK